MDIIFVVEGRNCKNRTVFGVFAVLLFGLLEAEKILLGVTRLLKSNKLF